MIDDARSRESSIRWLVALGAALLALLLAGLGCSARYRPADLGGLYSRAAQYHAPERRPVIVIPGILGSSLIDEETGQTAWGAFAGGYARPDRPAGARVVALPLSPGETDAVVATGVVERLKVRILGLPLVLKAYLNIIRVLGAGGYADEELGLAGVDYGEGHFTCFQFPYDFRLGNEENARRLGEFIEAKRVYVQSEIESRFGVVDAPVKFDIVAHSMGSLVTRYYLRYGTAELGDEGELPELTWAGAEYVERAILVGPPSAGSIEALVNLIEGEKFGPLIPRYPAALLGTFPSVYQLLPRARHGSVVWVDSGDPVESLTDPDLWRSLGWGLSSPDQAEVLEWLLPDIAASDERARVARDYQRWALRRAERFTAALDRPAETPPGLDLYLVAADSVPTAKILAVDRSTGAVHIREHGPGDGRVLRSSAIMDERSDDPWSPIVETPIDWSATLFLPDDHLGMTSNPVFSNNALHWLLEAPRATF